MRLRRREAAMCSRESQAPLQQNVSVKKREKNQPCQNSGTGGICAWKGGRGCGRKKQCFLCNSIRDYQRIAVNLSKADQNHGFPKGLRADIFLKRRMKFVNTSGKTGNIKYMETIFKRRKTPDRYRMGKQNGKNRRVSTSGNQAWRCILCRPAARCGK